MMTKIHDTRHGAPKIKTLAGIYDDVGDGNHGAIGDNVFDEKSEAKFKPLDYGIMQPVGLATPFVDKKAI